MFSIYVFGSAVLEMKDKAVSFTLLNPRQACLMFVLVSFLVLGMGTEALAEGLGDIADNLSGQTGALYDLAQKGAILIGFVLVIVGFFKLSSQRQQQQGIGGAVALIAVGFMLVSAGALVQYGSGTFFGDDSSELDQLK